METTRSPQSIKDIALKQVIKEKVDYFNQANDPRLVNDYLSMEGKILSMPLRLEEVLSVGLQLIYMNSYSTNDKINFLQSIENSWDKNCTKMSITEVAQLLKDYDYSFPPNHIFNFLNYFISIAKDNNRTHFNIYEPIDEDGNKVIHLATARNRYFKIATNWKELINSQNNAGLTPLHLAIIHYNQEPKEFSRMISVLLHEKKANPNIPDKQGNTPLHLTARQHLLDLSELLIEMGADVDAKNNEGKTPADIWAKIKEIKYEQLKPVQDFFNEHNTTINVMKDGPNAVNNAGRTALHTLIEHLPANERLLNLIKLLLSAGADINAHTRDKNSETPLIRLIRFEIYQDLTLIKFLIDQGADINIRDASGKTAKDWAIEKRNSISYPAVKSNYTQIIQMLEEAEKKTD